MSDLVRRPALSLQTPGPNESPGAGFSLRAWYTQALPPAVTFSWLYVLTVAEGTVIDGNVAVPAIYPGPLLVLPNARSISPAGIAAIIDEARGLGLLGDISDFTAGALPGAQLGQIELVVDGVRRELVGDPGRAVRCDGGRLIRGRRSGRSTSRSPRSASRSPPARNHAVRRWPTRLWTGCWPSPGRQPN